MKDLFETFELLGQDLAFGEIMDTDTAGEKELDLESSELRERLDALDEYGMEELDFS